MYSYDLNTSYVPPDLVEDNAVDAVVPAVLDAPAMTPAAPVLPAAPRAVPAAAPLLQFTGEFLRCAH